MRASWLAGVLRAAGIRVVELDGWKGRGSALVDIDSIVWHHDGSPPGASPSVPKYMAGQIDHGKPGAQCWVALDGTWHLVADGKVFHTGEVRVGKAGNSRALGIETDHTTGETWSGVHLLDSLRRGTAAILQHLDATEQAVEFHKTICSPPGRKTDPDGLDLAVERSAVAALLVPVIAPQEDDLPMSCVVPWVARRPNGRVPFLEVIPVQGANEAIVVSYNDAPLTPPWDDKVQGDDVLFSFWSRRLKGLTGPPVGIDVAPDRESIVVTCRGGGTYDVARKP